MPNPWWRLLISILIGIVFFPFYKKEDWLDVFSTSWGLTFSGLSIWAEMQDRKRKNSLEALMCIEFTKTANDHLFGLNNHTGPAEYYIILSLLEEYLSVSSAKCTESKNILLEHRRKIEVYLLECMTAQDSGSNVTNHVEIRRLSADIRSTLRNHSCPKYLS